MPLISIIVPVYNVRNYVEKCIKSLCSQTFLDLEIIIVDDGSTDGSGDVCEAIAQTDKRITVYHKENGGLSSARNYGIDRAKGKFIGFVDSDDYVDPDMYEILYHNITSFDADMALCGLYDIYDGKPQKINSENRTIVASPEETIKIVLEAEITSVTAVNKLYKRHLFDNIRYPEGKVSEDAFVIIDLLMNCSKTVITTAQKYYYIHRSGSITSSHFNPGTINVIEAYNKNYELVEKHYPRLLPIARMRLCWANFYVLDRLINDKTGKYRKIEKEVVEYLRNNIKFIICNEYFTIPRKISALCLMISKSLYRICVSVQRKCYPVSTNL